MLLIINERTVEQKVLLFCLLHDCHHFPFVQELYLYLWAMIANVGNNFSIDAQILRFCFAEEVPPQMPGGL